MQEVLEDDFSGNMKMLRDRNSFWSDAFSWHGSVTPLVTPYVVSIGMLASIICLAVWLIEQYFQFRISLEVAPFEIAGAALSLLLILRTNAGYDRWWEARKIWGGIVNQSRNVAISAVSYGRGNVQWRHEFVRWAIAFPHIARCSLRGEPPSPEVYEVLGQHEADAIANANHMPGYVALRLANLLAEARSAGDLDGYAFLQIDKERATLIDHIGACERILKTPLPIVYSIKIRRFIVLFLLTVPFALLHQLQEQWLIPFITMLVAYPLMALDQIGIELQNPFATKNLSHLPLSTISANIESNLKSLLDTVESENRDRQSDHLAATA